MSQRKKKPKPAGTFQMFIGQITIEQNGQRTTRTVSIHQELRDGQWVDVPAKKGKDRTK